MEYDVNGYYDVEGGKAFLAGRFRIDPPEVEGHLGYLESRLGHRDTAELPIRGWERERMLEFYILHVEFPSYATLNLRFQRDDFRRYAGWIWMLVIDTVPELREGGPADLDELLKFPFHLNMSRPGKLGVMRIRE